MKRPLVITAFILLLNSVFFSLGGYELINQQSFLVAEIWRTIYKLLVYVWPVAVCIYWWKNDSTIESIIKKFKWYKEYWVYVLWIAYWIMLFVWKQTVDAHEAIYGLFYVLVVNSLIEETVFRWYIQSLLVEQYWKFKWIVSQAVLFGVVHLPFYYTHYESWLYDQINTMIWWFLPLEWVWPFVIVFALGTPIALWLLRWWITNKTQSLRPAIVWHSFHNWMLLLI